jgi:short-subunit dehydrogenase
VARKLAARGARLALAGMEPERLAELARELGPQHVWFACDVTDSTALQRAVDGTISALGRIDVVIANAGIASLGTVAISPIEALARVVDVNLTGVIRTVHAALPHVIASKGYVLLVSSAAAIAPAPGLAIYSATKSGVEHFGNALRGEVRSSGVAVGVVHPSWIDTDLVRDPQRTLGSFREMIRRLPGPFGAITSLDVCADAIVDGIAHRRRKIYVPKSLRIFAAIRPLLSSRLFDSVNAMKLGDTLPKMEQEVTALGRSFGETSVEAERRS